MTRKNLRGGPGKILHSSFGLKKDGNRDPVKVRRVMKTPFQREIPEYDRKKGVKTIRGKVSSTKRKPGYNLR